MYRLLFAEDERETREGILEMIDFAALGIGEIRAAKNGVEALEQARGFRPDILLTDIRMPRMNGIQLAEEIRRENPNCSILMISGYSDRSYLLSAIALKAVDFVDKPLDLTTLAKQLSRAVAEQDALSEKLLYQKREFATLLSQEHTQPSLIRRHLEELFPGIAPNACCCLMITCRGEQTTSEAQPSPNTLSGMQDLEAACSRLLADGNVPCLLHPYSPETLLVYLFSAKEPRETLDKTRALFAALLGETPGLFILAGPFVPVEQAYDSLKTALTAAELLFYQRESCFLSVNAHTLEPYYQNQQRMPRALLEALGTQSKEEKPQLFIQTLQKMSEHFYQYPVLPVTMCTDYYSKALLLFLQHQFASDKIIDQDSVWSTLSRCSSLAEMNRVLTEYITGATGKLSQNETEDPLIRRILTIIREQYRKPQLTLEQICRQTFLSASYVCVRFKKATGTTLGNYITEYRIRASLPLLADPLRKLDDIAESVGIDNGNYYSKLFKKYMGMSPNQYRQNLHA